MAMLSIKIWHLTGVGDNVSKKTEISFNVSIIVVVVVVKHSEMLCPMYE